MSKCPDYYMTAHGEEFFDYFSRAIGIWLRPACENLSHGYEIYHCLFSSAEHRFRCGLKEGEGETDIVAMHWWEEKGRAVYDRYDHAGYSADGRIMPYERIARAVASAVDYQRSLKDLAAEMIDTN